MEKIQFYGIDRFNRPVFKSLDGGKGKFYGDVHNLFGYDATEAEVLAKVTVNDLCYFGSRFDCEPYGTPVTNLEIVVAKSSDTDLLTAKLINAGADRAKVIAVVDGYGDAVDWSYHSLDSIIGEVWQSDLNSGDDPDSWIINEICRSFNIEEVKE